VQVAHLGLEPEAVEQGDGEQCEQKHKSFAAKGAAEQEMFGEKMQKGDAGAPVLDDGVTGQDVLCDYSHERFLNVKADFFRENHWQADRDKHGRPEPDRCVDHPNEPQNLVHTRTYHINVPQQHRISVLVKASLLFAAY
jgi:hypothetical protein